MYWEQLELRCRSLYSTQPPPSVSTVGPTIIGTPRNTACRCCEQCHAHRNAMATAATYPWDSDGRFWLPGQAGNFYSPNPGSEDHLTTGQRSNQMRNGNNNRGPGWSWPRMPWQRANDQRGFRQTPSSPDSQYGFSNNSVPEQGGVANATAMTTVQSNYTLINAPYGVWGPPPPYSDPNSPARRINNNGRYQYISSVPMQCQPTTVVIQGEMQVANVQSVQSIEHHQRSIQETPPPMTYSPSAQAHLLAQAVPQMRKQRHSSGKSHKDTNFENAPSDSDGPSRDKFSNTLPVRKVKKRHVDHGVKSIGSGGHNPVQRVNVQEIFRPQSTVIEHEYNEPAVIVNVPGTSTRGDELQQQQIIRQSRRAKMTKGVENNGFLELAVTSGPDTDHSSSCKQEVRQGEPAESEVYFGDVSSCCNISVQNDNFYDDSSSGGHRKRSTPNTSSSDKSFTKDDADDYLAQRFGKRDPSVRSRLPFPQIPEMYDPSPVVSPRTSLIPKDISRQSMCSVDSSTGDKTDYTDLSPATPINPPYPSESSPFVPSSFPYLSNDQSQEAHKRLTKNLPEVFLNSEINNKTSDTSPLTMINYDSSGPSPTFNFEPQSLSSSTRSPKIFKMVPNLTPKSRSHRTPNDTSVQNSGNKDKSSDSGWQDQHDRRL